MKIEIAVDGEKCSEQISRLLTLADANFTRQRLDDRLVKFSDIWWRRSVVGNRNWLYLLLVDDRARHIAMLGQTTRSVKDDLIDCVDTVIKEAAGLLETGHFSVMDHGQGILHVVDPLPMPTSPGEIARLFEKTEEELASATQILGGLLGARYSFDPPVPAFPIGRQGPSYDQYLSS